MPQPAPTFPLPDNYFAGAGRVTDGKLAAALNAIYVAAVLDPLPIKVIDFSGQADGDAEIRMPNDAVLALQMKDTLGNLYKRWVTTDDGHYSFEWVPLRLRKQAIDMADSNIAILLGTAPGGGQVTLEGNVLAIDPEGVGTHFITVPPPSASHGFNLYCYNSGTDPGENVHLIDAGTYIATLGPGEGMILSCVSSSFWKVVGREPGVIEGTIATAAVKTLNATPVEVIPSPGVGYYIEVLDVVWWLDYATVAYDAAAAGDTLGLTYGTGGPEITAPVPGDTFGGASADVRASAGRAPVGYIITNAGVFVQIQGGEWYAAAGDSPVKYRIRYVIRKEMA